MNRILLGIIAVTLFSACNSIKVIQNSDPTIDISKSKTYSFYGWLGETDDLIEVDTEAFEKAFVDEFTKRGMTYQKDGGDIVISLMVVVSKESTKNRYNSYYGVGGSYGFYQPTWGWGYGQPYGSHGGNYAGVPYKENAYLYGTIVCDIFERGNKKLAWQGVASKAINPKAKKKESQAPKIVNLLLRRFPVEIIKD